MSVKPYLSLAELVEQIPYTEQAIRAMIQRREFREGEHFFRRGRRLIFKWAAIAEWIEGGTRPADVLPLHRARGIG